MAEFPPPPDASLIDTDIGFKVRDVKGHVESTWSRSTKKWSAPKFVASPHFHLHGMSPALNYGMQCYEGLKAFRHVGDKEISIFRPDMNAERMQHSARCVSIEPVDEHLFLECVQLAVSMNASWVPPHDTGAALYIRPLLFGSSPQLGLNVPEEYTFAVFVTPTGVYHGSDPVKALILDNFDRAAPRGTGSAKVGGNYAPVLRYSEQAKLDGYGITLHLDSQTRTEIDEFSTSAFIGVIKDPEEDDDPELIIPDSKNVIESITAASICTIAEDLGWDVTRRKIRVEELGDFQEVMAAGTAAALVPIKSITHGKKEIKYRNGSDEIGPITDLLLKRLKAIQMGDYEDKHGWLHKVYPPPKQWTEEHHHSNSVSSISGHQSTTSLHQSAMDAANSTLNKVGINDNTSKEKVVNELP